MQKIAIFNNLCYNNNGDNMQNKVIKYGNRGMTLENDINITNDYYKNNNIALIYKKPTPIKVIKVNYAKTRILDGFYETQSTLDYIKKNILNLTLKKQEVKLVIHYLTYININ